jgi:hypothetical protein
MHISRLAIEFLGNVLVRQVEPHEIQASSPHPQGLMLTGKDRVRHIVEASLTGRPQVTLTLRRGSISALFGDCRAATSWTLDTVRPAEGTDGLNTFGVVNETRLWPF